MRKFLAARRMDAHQKPSALLINEIKQIEAIWFLPVGHWLRYGRATTTPTQSTEAYEMFNSI